MAQDLPLPVDGPTSDRNLWCCIRHIIPGYCSQHQMTQLQGASPSRASSYMASRIPPVHLPSSSYNLHLEGISFDHETCYCTYSAPGPDVTRPLLRHATSPRRSETHVVFQYRAFTSIDTRHLFSSGLCPLRQSTSRKRIAASPDHLHPFSTAFNPGEWRTWRPNLLSWIILEAFTFCAPTQPN